jgi:hypothetical protein
MVKSSVALKPWLSMAAVLASWSAPTQWLPGAISGKNAKLSLAPRKYYIYMIYIYIIYMIYVYDI